MGDLDPAPFQELFSAEPADATASDAPAWIRLYEELIAMMQRQLEETRAFAMRSPEALNRYLGRENIAILEEEIDTFKNRLAHWANAGGSQQ